MNRIIVFIILMGIPLGVLEAAEDNCRDAQEAVQVLCLLGGKGAAGLSPSVITSYRLIFERIDLDGDGYATREEYIEKGRYLTKQSRAGIFRASDRDGDQVVSEKEYVENRIITDEAKEIFERLKLDGNNTVDRNELAKALGVIGYFCENAGVTQAHLLQCDVTVTRDEWLEPEQLQAYEIRGFGGSDMSPAMQQMAQDPEVEAVIVLTDGMIDYPSDPTPYDVLWAVCHDYELDPPFEPPYGTVIPLVASPSKSDLDSD